MGGCWYVCVWVGGWVGVGVLARSRVRESQCVGGWLLTVACVHPREQARACFRACLGACVIILPSYSTFPAPAASRAESCTGLVGSYTHAH